MFPLDRLGRASFALLAVLGMLLANANAEEPVSDLTITISGELLKHGGVVRIYHLPTPSARWTSLAEQSTGSIELHGRYAEIQLRYPENGTFTYRFAPVSDVPEHSTQVLTVIGTDFDNIGPGMTVGFTGDKSAGGRVIRVPSLAELAGSDEASKTNAKWGVTQLKDDPPPADERSARSLASLLDRDATAENLECEGDGRVQVCTVRADAWSQIETRWWRAIAELRLDRLEHHALRHCYDSGGFFSRPSRCRQDPDSDEPKFIAVD